MSNGLNLSTTYPSKIGLSLCFYFLRRGHSVLYLYPIRNKARPLRRTIHVATISFFINTGVIFFVFFFFTLALTFSKSALYTQLIETVNRANHFIVSSPLCRNENIKRDRFVYFFTSFTNLIVVEKVDSNNYLFILVFPNGFTSFQCFGKTEQADFTARPTAATKQFSLFAFGGFVLFVVLFFCFVFKRRFLANIPFIFLPQTEYYDNITLMFKVRKHEIIR